MNKSLYRLKFKNAKKLNSQVANINKCCQLFIRYLPINYLHNLKDINRKKNMYNKFFTQIKSKARCLLLGFGLL